MSYLDDFIVPLVNVISYITIATPESFNTKLSSSYSYNGNSVCNGGSSLAFVFDECMLLAITWEEL